MPYCAASTTHKNMINGDVYADNPHILVFRMLTALANVLLMMVVVAFFTLPISMTHTIPGSIAGFSIVTKGFESMI